MTDFDRLQVQLYKLSISFQKEEENVIRVPSPSNPAEYVIVIYSPIKDVVAWMEAGGAGFGIAETYHELVSKITSFIYESAVDFVKIPLDNPEDI